MSSSVEAAFFILVGDHQLEPNRPDQEIELYFRNTDSVQDIAGLDFNLQVADGGPTAGRSLLGPTITGVDLKMNTVFGGVAATQVASPSTDQVRVASITLDSGTVSVPIASDPTLLLATVTLDTTGFTTAGQSWSLSLNNTLNGDSKFLDGAASGIALSSTSGSISITPVPEPSTYGVVMGLAVIAYRRWGKRCSREGQSVDLG